MIEDGGEKKRSALSLSSAMEALSEDQIKKNLFMKGWLKKKSPAMLKSWQKRYFITIEHMNIWKLVYFEDDKVQTKPKGAFDLPTIQQVHIKDQRIIVINFPSRELELKAKSPELAQQWVTVLQACRTIKSRPKARISLDQTVKTLEQLSPTKDTKLTHKIIDTETAQIAQMVKENEGRNSGQYDGEQTKAKKQQIQLSNEKMLELVGLKDFMKQLNEQFISNRVIYGYIGKRSKGNLKYFQNRWFVLISAKSLNPMEYNDEKILFENQLPPWIELDSLVYFKCKDESKAPKAKGNIKMLDCQEIILKNMQNSKESGYTFKLNMGDRLYHLMTETELERMKWQTALSQSIKTSREINNPFKIIIKKNVDVIVNLYDEETSLPLRREQLKKKINEDIESTRNAVGINLETINSDFNLFLKYLAAISQDMLETMQGCVVKDPQRKDIIKEYIDIVHERICDMITSYWDETYQKIDSPCLLKLAQWLNQYQSQLHDFFNDDRVTAGIRVLLHIFVTRSLDNLEPIIFGIVEQEKKCEPHLNDQEQLVTKSPIDLFKIINEGFDAAYNLCRCKETVLKMGCQGKQLISIYQHGIEELIDENNLKADKLIAICNNTITLFDQTKEYAKRLQLMGSISEEECDKVFDTQRITKQFVHLSNMCRERFFLLSFGQIQKHFKKFYLDIQIIEILKSIIEPVSDQISYMHDSFSRKIWKQLSETIIIYYINSLIISCSKAKKEQQDEFITKLEQDKDTLFQELEAFIFEKQLQSILKPCDDIAFFLQEESLTILEPCKNLRIYFGKAFTEKTVKQIMTIRYDLNKEKKKDILDSCKEIIETYNRQNKDETVVISNTRLLDILGFEEEQINNGSQEQFSMVQSVKKRDSITLELSDEQFEDNSKSKSGEEESKKDYLEEGYLYKKKPKQKWDYRYFRIRKGYLYWYIDANSREAQNKMDLAQVDDVYPHQTKTNKFFIQLEGEGGKTYKFKANSQEERDLWVKSIIREQNLQEQLQLQKIEAIKTGEGKKPLIKDYDEIARKERLKQKQQERIRKRQEKEAELKKKLQSEPKQQQPQQTIVIDNPPPQAFDTEENEQKQEPVSCCTSLLILLGLKRRSKVQTQ